MALTQEQKDFMLEEMAAQFDYDIPAFQAWLKRSALQAQMDKIQSSIRNAQAEQSADIDAYNAQIQSLQTQLNDKQAEIDLL